MRNKITRIYTENILFKTFQNFLFQNLDVLLFKDFLAENIPFKIDPLKMGIL